MSKKNEYEAMNNEVASRFLSLANDQKTKREKKADTVKEVKEKKEKRLHSFLMEPGILRMLQKYARVRNRSITDIVNTSIFEYMKRNPPTEAEIKAFSELNDIEF